MTTVSERSLARCDGCGKLYRIPDASRRYACKACGGVVTVEEEEPEVDLESTLTCTACHAVNEGDAEDCIGCGQDLHVTAPRTHDEGREAQREASLSLKRDYKWIGGITWLYRLGAAGYLVGSAIAIGALVSTDVPLQGGTLVAALFVTMTVLMLMGAIQILFRPFEWTLAVAVVATITAAVHAFGPNPLGVAIYWSLGWAVAYWICVAPTWRFRRDIRRHTDLYVTHHASRATRHGLEGRSPKERHDRLVRAMRRANKHAWRVSLGAAGVVVLAAVVSTNMVRGSMRPELVTDSIERFEAAWRAEDLATLAGFFPGSVGEREVERMLGSGSGHGWSERMPALGERTLREDGHAAEVDYEVDGVPVSLHWARDEQSWVIVEVKLPIPPLDPVLVRFRRAWREKGADGVAQFYSESNRSTMRSGIAEAAKKRGWDPFPAITDTVRDGVDESKDVNVTFQVEEGAVTSRWTLRMDGTWGLAELRLPRKRKN